jgi:hypothetical protein
MTTCSGWDERLSAYLDDRVSVEEKRLVEEHLAICGDCRLMLSELSKTKELVHSLDKAEPPPWLTDKIMTRVREEAEGRRGIFERLFHPFHIKIPLEVFATCLVAVFSFYLYKTVGPDTATFPESQRPPIVANEESPRKEDSKLSTSRADKANELKTQDRAGVQSQVDQMERAQPGETYAPAPAATATERTDKGLTETKAHTGGARPDSRIEAAERPGTLAAAPERKQSPAAVPAPPPAARAPVAPSAEHRSMSKEKVEGLDTVGSERRAILSVTVRDVSAANREVERLLLRFGGSSVSVESREDFVARNVRMPGDKTSAFQEALRSIGRVEIKDLLTGTSEEHASFRLEIRPNNAGTGSSVK